MIRNNYSKVAESIKIAEELENEHDPHQLANIVGMLLDLALRNVPEETIQEIYDEVFAEVPPEEINNILGPMLENLENSVEKEAFEKAQKLKEIIQKIQRRVEP